MLPRPRRCLNSTVRAMGRSGYQRVSYLRCWRVGVGCKLLARTSLVGVVHPIEGVAGDRKEPIANLSH